MDDLFDYHLLLFHKCMTENSNKLLVVEKSRSKVREKDGKMHLWVSKKFYPGAMDSIAKSRCNPVIWLTLDWDGPGIYIDPLLRL